VESDEIDQKRLKAIRQEFIKLSELRFSQMQESLSPTQADYLKLLPLLFHVNHPMLPGYVDKFTPCGLPNYTPSMVEKKIAKTVSQSFEYKPRAYLSYRIAALYLMGSMGTLGQSNSSDIDLWVCLSEPLESSLTKKLTNKANNIKNWLAEIGIELNYYLVNLDDFSGNRSKKIEVDSCGNAQKFLLLDEFYRTAVWFAGRWPMWWLIPTEKNYASYAKRLIEQKHLDSADWIDFGEVQSIPASEYFSASLWQLYKAIESPYKSLVKLLLIEIYAKLFPCAGILSDEFKNKIHQGYSDPQEVDPYFLILQFAEKALKDTPQRLEFSRRAFYLKVNVKIKATKKNRPNWRYTSIKKLIHNWGWSQTRLDYLNNRQHWDIATVIHERKDLVRELTNSYHFLSNFARVQGVINKVAKNELLSLGRRLYAAFERRNGKIEVLNNGIAKDIIEDVITLNEDREKGWQFYLKHLNRDNLSIEQPVFVGRSLLDCLCWGCANKVINKHTHCQIYSPSEFLNLRFASEAIIDILKLLKSFEHFESKIDFNKSAKLIAFGLFFNSRNDPLKDEKKNNFYRVATKSDYLSWTDTKTNLVSHFDMLAINSWGELTIQHFSGDTAWVTFFKQHHKYLPDTIESLSMFCRGLVQSDSIIQRTVDLLEKWRHLLIKSQRTRNGYRYLMAVERKWISVFFQDSEIEYYVYSSLNKMLVAEKEVELTASVDKKIIYQIDTWLPISPFLNKVLNRRLSNNLDCFIYQKSRQQFEIAVRSQNGRLHFQTHRNTSTEQLIAHYQQFFDKVYNRAKDHVSVQALVNYYSFTPERSQFKKVEIKSSFLQQEFSLVQAIAVYRSSRLVGFDLFTANESYLYIEFGEQAYVKLVKQLLIIRKEARNYPIFLTDLDLSQVNIKASFIELLDHKRQIEEKLNKVMRKLLAG